MADGDGYLLYAKAGKSPRRWRNVKQALRFCQVTQDGDEEGVMRLDRLPAPSEAALIREQLGIRKRRHLSAEEIAARTANFRRPQSPSKTAVPRLGSTEPTGPVPESIRGRLAAFELADQ